MNTPRDFTYYLGTRHAKADYQYDITDDYIILIEDLDQGNVSVTNDIQNVLADIMRDQDRKNLTGYRVLYRDSEGDWDEALLGENGLFKQFGGNGGLDKAAALTIMRSKYSAVSMSPQTTPTPAPARFQDVRDPISRALLGTGIHCLYKPNFEKEAEPWELDDPEARKEWEEDVEMDEQCGRRANSTDYFYALTVVNPEVGEQGQEVALPPRVIVEVHQVALQIAAARKAGRDREEFCDELEEKRRGITG